MLGLPYTISEIATACFAKDLFQGQFQPETLRYVSFDTRTLHHGSQTIFIALQTENRDGHKYIPQAIEKGVRNFIVSRPIDYPDINYVLVEDTLEALQLWARQHRLRFNYPVIGISGSNGKTIVKEWLASLIELDYQLVKSPMSYNSQLGVPVSILQMHPQAELAIIEVGISRAGEMDILTEIIQPTIGILTHMGPAHADGFNDQQHKLQEKLKLFTGVEKLLIHSNQEEVFKTIQKSGIPFLSIGTRGEDTLRVQSAQLKTKGWEISVNDKKLLLLQKAEADLDNALVAILAARHLSISWEVIGERLEILYPVRMRTEMITDNPEITLINDSYNSDLDSIHNAFHLLMQTQHHPNHHIILTDLEHLGDDQERLQEDILDLAIQMVGKDHVHTIGAKFAGMRRANHYVDTKAFRNGFQYEVFKNSTVLLKGARKFSLEQLLPLFNKKLNTASFRIDLNALSNNYRYLKSLLPQETKTMCMVKAYSYGSGSWEIARVLEDEGATYLAVAYASEGIELRQANIQTPIMVMNADLESIPTLLDYDIEPEVYNFDFLERYLRAARFAKQSEYRIHIKLETGMGRLGFRENEIDHLIQILLSYPDVNVISVMSHLAAADDPQEDEFSYLQIERFQKMHQQLQTALGIYPFRHILNTAGILRFPEYTMDMVRMGIGLYGVDPVGQHEGLKEIGRLQANISHIELHPAGTSIGYGRSQFTERDSRVATIPLGYADGIPRALSNGKGNALVLGKRAPFIGRVCMDMLMLDVTDIPDASVGDEVVIFGEQGEEFISVNELAQQVGTIPYEILTRISPRVRRLYIRE